MLRPQGAFAVFDLLTTGSPNFCAFSFEAFYPTPVGLSPSSLGPNCLYPLWTFPPCLLTPHLALKDEDTGYVRQAPLASSSSPHPHQDTQLCPLSTASKLCQPPCSWHTTHVLL